MKRIRKKEERDLSARADRPSDQLVGAMRRKGGLCQL